MCYSRKSLVSDERKPADADQSKDMANKRTERVDTLLREAAKEGQKVSPSEAPARESIPAK